MMKLIIFLLLLLPSVVFAQTVTLSWDASPSDNVTGYKVYYQATPYVAGQWDGSGATEGNSPVDAGNVLTYQLTNLIDGVVYYFAVSAYDADSNESTYSNVVHSSPAGGGVIHIGGVGRINLGGNGHAQF